MALDLNQIKCGCNSTTCEIGVRFDSNPDVLIYQDKYGQDSIIKLSKENVNQFIEHFTEVKKRNNW